MCGLAGFARHPDAPGLMDVVKVHRDLMVEAQHRGRHATGAAVLSPTSSVLKKWAVPMDDLLKSGVYHSEVEGSIPRDVKYMIGHTRHATLPNKHDDNAAHPFAFERTVGCHNGTIVNWREIQRDHNQDGWVTDSQAAIWSVDSCDDPADALKLLDGWWALSWVKAGRLFLTRTTERPLAVAYSKKLRTLFWASEKKRLKSVLKSHGVGVKIWELNADTLYEFDPAQFNGEANPTKSRVKLDRPSARHATKKDKYQGDLWAGKRTWADDAVERNRRPRTFAAFSHEVDKKLEDVFGRLESLEHEVEFLYEVIDKMGGLEYGLEQWENSDDE